MCPVLLLRVFLKIMIQFIVSIGYVFVYASMCVFLEQNYILAVS